MREVDYGKKSYTQLKKVLRDRLYYMRERLGERNRKNSYAYRYAQEQGFLKGDNYVDFNKLSAKEQRIQKASLITFLQSDITKYHSFTSGFRNVLKRLEGKAENLMGDLKHSNEFWAVYNELVEEFPNILYSIDGRKRRFSDQVLDALEQRYYDNEKGLAGFYGNARSFLQEMRDKSMENEQMVDEWLDNWLDTH